MSNVAFTSVQDESPIVMSSKHMHPKMQRLGLRNKLKL